MVVSWGYPQIIQLSRVFNCKPSSYWGTPMPMENLHIELIFAIEVSASADITCFPHSDNRMIIAVYYKVAPIALISWSTTRTMVEYHHLYTINIIKHPQTKES